MIAPIVINDETTIDDLWDQFDKALREMPAAVLAPDQLEPLIEVTRFSFYAGCGSLVALLNRHKNNQPKFFGVLDNLTQRIAGMAQLGDVIGKLQKGETR